MGQRMMDQTAQRFFPLWAGLIFGIFLSLCLVTDAKAVKDPLKQRHDAVGQVLTYPIRAQETLLDVARHFELGYLDIVAANPGVDPWLPGQGTVLTIPTAFVLPDAPRKGIVINLAEQRLYYYPPNGQAVQTYPLGVGRDGLETPKGTTKVKRKKEGPSWRPTKRMREEDPELPAVVPPGPDNPLGAFALYLGWPQYLIHGTHKPWGVGRRVSSGCIRLYPEGIERLFSQVSIGTMVTVVDQPAKLGWVGDDLYLEVHTSQKQADQLEEEGKFGFEDIDDLILQIIRLAGKEQSRLLWDVVQKAVQERNGVPQRITRQSTLSVVEGEADKAANALAEMAKASQAPRKSVEIRSMISMDFIEQEFRSRQEIPQNAIADPGTEKEKGSLDGASGAKEEGAAQSSQEAPSEQHHMPAAGPHQPTSLLKQKRLQQATPSQTPSAGQTLQGGQTLSTRSPFGRHETAHAQHAAPTVQNKDLKALTEDPLKGGNVVTEGEWQTPTQADDPALGQKWFFKTESGQQP